MTPKSKHPNLSPLSEWVNETYNGHIPALTLWLDRAIYLLHFLPADEDVSPRERRRVAHALHSLKERLLQAHHIQQGKTFKPLAS